MHVKKFIGPLYRAAKYEIFVADMTDKHISLAAAWLENIELFFVELQNFVKDMGYLLSEVLLYRGNPTCMHCT